MHYPPNTVRASIPTKLGPMTLAATSAALVGAWFEGQRHYPDTSAWRVAPQHAVLLEAGRQMQAYLDGTLAHFDVPIDLSGGTTFQQAVWAQLRAIPAGHTSSYGTISQALGNPAASRAVGAAVGRNPISVIVPCHRVLGAQGALTGYAGGLERKVALLQLEQSS